MPSEPPQDQPVDDDADSVGIRNSSNFLQVSEAILNQGEVEADGYLEKELTGVSGFDAISYGGVPAGRATLVAGTAGSGKTVLGMQFLAKSISDGGGAVFVTFEESPEDLRDNVKAFGWDLRAWEREGKFAMVDASPPDHQDGFIGAFDLDALLSRIGLAVEKTGAKRVVLDSLSGLYGQGFGNRGSLRFELFRLIRQLKQRQLTVLMTVERARDTGTTDRHQIDEFVADSVVLLRNTLVNERRRRTFEILKYRGSRHLEGEAPFTIDANKGIVSQPLSSLELTQQSSNHRVRSGVDELDVMCGGGFFRDSVTLVSGPTGTGKTLLASHFVAQLADGERGLLLAYEESREQLIRNAASFGIDLPALEASGQLKILCQYPEVQDLQGHLLQITEMVHSFQPNRVALDSLSALQRVANGEHFRDFLIGVNSLFKRQEIVTLMTNTSRDLVGSKSVSEQHISTLTDSIILLRYAEIGGSITRGLLVLKMRGSDHEEAIRRFDIDSSGMRIGGGFDGVTGIMSGTVRPLMR